MFFTDLKIDSEYRNKNNDVAKNLFIPLLSNALSYKRAVGYFSSSSLVDYSKGICELAKKKGKMQLIASPYLNEDDIEAIRLGYKKRDSVLKSALLKGLEEECDEPFAKERLNLLANLIADGILDIHIAYLEDDDSLGLYHEKMGIMEDSKGNKVAFSGSNNETHSAIGINYETVDVYCDWQSEFEKNQVRKKENAFHAIWNNGEPGIEVLDFPEINDALIEKYKYDKSNYDIDEIQFKKSSGIQTDEIKYLSVEHYPVIPREKGLRPYQIEAIDKWEEKDYCGIFDMATGTGKTYTGLGAIVRLSDALHHKLAVIICCPYQHLVEQWVEDIVLFGMDPIVGYSGSRQKNWKKLLENAIRDQKLNVANRDFFCFVTTNATFSSEYVQKQINKIKCDSLLVVDEAHNFGAEYLRHLLLPRFNYRLALSATLDRHDDPIGTQALYDYFGEKCIEYSLEKAIKEEKLTPYKYYPIVVNLSESEYETYEDLTDQISKCIKKGTLGGVQLTETGKKLALQRARLVAGAVSKIEALAEEIKPYINKKHILVYCGATNVLDENQDVTNTDQEDLRQIDVVTDLLGNHLGMKVSQFTSKEDIEERQILKEEFAIGDNLQALIAIKCLDEGVNIPQIRTAFILASTTNPKEYIQRRGRVLRTADGKDFAEIYDFITLPRPLDEVSSLTKKQIKKELTLVKNELNRAEEFARIALNKITALSVLDEIKEAYGLEDYQIVFEEDYGDGE